MSTRKYKRGTVYVLELKDNCYYIGFTTWLDLRIKQHFEDSGAKFIKLHRPIRIIETFENVTKFMEHTITIRYIKKHGVNNVRGGRWCGTTPNSYCPYFK